MSALLTRDLDVILGSSRILHGISVSIEEGSAVAVLGANGSGKSTLIRAMMGIIPSARGTVEIFGHDITDRSRVPWKRMGYVPQRVAAASGVPATALEVVRSGLLGPTSLWADRGPGAKRKAMEALERVGLADRANDHVQVFSGGQSQRVLIARALVRHPDLLILDEPLAGIDRDSREALAETLQALHGAGVTIVAVLHDMGELGPLIERTIALEDGHVAFDGPPVGIGAQAEIHHHTDETPTPHHAPVLRTETS